MRLSSVLLKCGSPPAAFAGALFLSIVACVGDSSTAPTPSQLPVTESAATPTPVVVRNGDGYSVTVYMSAQTGSFQVGEAIIESFDGGTRVTVDVTPPGDTAQPMRIHFGDCSSVGDIFYTLENVVRGHSVTLIDMPISDVVKSGRLINIHRSFQDFPTYTACGELPDIR